MIIYLSECCKDKYSTPRKRVLSKPITDNKDLQCVQLVFSYTVWHVPAGGRAAFERTPHMSNEGFIYLGENMFLK